MQDLGLSEPSQSTSPVTINAHQSDLACLALNQDGTLLATASKQVYETSWVYIILANQGW